jgi:pimeloyl-ACP methyl ester carboxylesterase
MDVDVSPLLIKWLAISIVIVVILYSGLSGFGAKMAMEIPRLPLISPPPPAVLKYENISFTSRDDAVTLKGWFFPGDNRAAVIIVNGGFENRVDDNSDTLGIAAALVKKGYGVLLFDLRGRGESEGKGRSLSNIDRDLGGAVDYLGGREYAPENVFILGFCSGAASACIFAAQNDIGAVILDGCFIDVPTMVTREAATYHIPSWLVRLFTPGLSFMSRLLYSYREVDPIDVVGNIKCPVFFIHEEYDDFITWDETQQLYRASHNPANRIWQVAGALHSQSFRTSPEEYIAKVDDFLKKANVPPGG